MPKYKVKEGHTVTYGSDPSKPPGARNKVASAGEIIEIDEKEAKAMDHAVEEIKEDSGRGKKKGGDE